MDNEFLVYYLLEYLSLESFNSPMWLRNFLFFFCIKLPVILHHPESTLVGDHIQLEIPVSLHNHNLNMYIAIIDFFTPLPFRFRCNRARSLRKRNDQQLWFTIVGLEHNINIKSSLPSPEVKKCKCPPWLGQLLVTLTAAIPFFRAFNVANLTACGAFNVHFFIFFYGNLLCNSFQILTRTFV